MLKELRGKYWFRALIDTRFGSIDKSLLRKALLSYLSYLHNSPDDIIFDEIIKMYGITVRKGTLRGFMIRIMYGISKYVNLFGLTRTSIVNRALSRYLNIEIPPSPIKKRRGDIIYLKIRRSTYNMLEELSNKTGLSIEETLSYISEEYFKYFEKLPTSYKLQELIAMNNIYARYLYKKEDKTLIQVHAKNMEAFNIMKEKYNLRLSCNIAERMIPWYYFKLQVSCNGERGEPYK